MVSSNSPSDAAYAFAPSRPITSPAASNALSTVTGLVFPGIILLPATSSWVGMSISPRAVSGPENISLRSWQSL